MQTNVANQISNITVEDDRTGLSIETLKRALPPISCVFSRFRFFFWTNIMSRKSSVFATKINIEFYTGRAQVEQDTLYA